MIFSYNMLIKNKKSCHVAQISGMVIVITTCSEEAYLYVQMQTYDQNRTDTVKLQVRH